jgi:hypothetical protein
MKITYRSTLLLSILVLVTLPATHAHARYADGANLYQYVQSRPTMAVDPMGLQAEEEATSIPAAYTSPYAPSPAADLRTALPATPVGTPSLPPLTIDSASLGDARIVAVEPHFEPHEYGQRVRYPYGVSLIEFMSGPFEGHCILEVSVRMNWRFINSSGRSFDASDKAGFIAQMSWAIRDVWEDAPEVQLMNPSQECCTCENGTVFRFHFEHTIGQEEQTGYHQMEAQVLSTPNRLRGWTVRPGRLLRLDTNDTIHSERAPGHYQRDVAHEFGHLLGPMDDYRTGYEGGDTGMHHDTASIMHSGETVRPRHVQHFANWMTEVISGDQGNCNYGFNE